MQVYVMDQKIQYCDRENHGPRSKQIARSLGRSLRCMAVLNFEGA